MTNLPAPSSASTASARVNPAMAARGMRPAAELAADKPCGTRVRYGAGCRCAACRRANTDYERGRAAARARGERNGLVSAERARAHLAALSAAGVGRRTVADAAMVAESIVGKVIDGQRRQIRAQTERRILAVTVDAAADRAYIDGAATWQLLDELIACGYSRARLASEMAGRKVAALQLGRERVTVRNAERARRVYELLRYADIAASRRALALVAELREEGYRLDRIQQALASAAARRGRPAPPLDTATKGQRKGCMRLLAVQLIGEAHAALMGITTTDEELANVAL